VAGPVASLRALYRNARQSDYIGEGVSQLDHALQAAQLARAAGAADAEVLGALLHDVGHLCAPADAPSMEGLGIVAHEQFGAAHLAALGISRGVTELVRGHVAAKRYLVAVRPDYAARLSLASQGTLRQQGGPMTPDECSAFEQDPRRDALLRLRSWDDQAKVPGLEAPDFDAYVPLLEADLRGAAG
jgi:phosphonate degradation associated HDIG domain protein